MILSSDLRLSVWMFAAGRMVLRVFLGLHGTLVAVSAPFMMPLRDSDIPMNVPFTFSNKQPGHYPSDDWELQKDAEKQKRYAPVLEFFNSLPVRQGWSLIQFNFTVGVRGSISTEDRTDPLSFVSTLKALYYAVKFSSSPSVDFSRLLGNSFALQHCLRLPI